MIVFYRVLYTTYLLEKEMDHLRKGLLPPFALHIEINCLEQRNFELHRYYMLSPAVPLSLMN